MGEDVLPRASPLPCIGSTTYTAADIWSLCVGKFSVALACWVLCQNFYCSGCPFRYRSCSGVAQRRAKVRRGDHWLYAGQL